jgi:hypothetical protein
MSPVLHLVTRQLRLSQEMTSCLLAGIRDRDDFFSYLRQRSKRWGMALRRWAGEVSFPPFYFGKRKLLVLRYTHVQPCCAFLGIVAAPRLAKLPSPNPSRSLLAVELFCVFSLASLNDLFFLWISFTKICILYLQHDRKPNFLLGPHRQTESPIRTQNV